MHTSFIFLLASIAATFIGVTGQQFHRFCYYNAWAFARDEENALSPESINPFLCTHIILSFAEIDETGLRLKDPNHYEQQYLYQRIVRLRRINPRLNIFLSVGGWDKGSEGFSKLVSSRANILSFTKWVITYLRRHDFDGLDLDWEYPTFRGSSIEDRHKFADLVDNLAYEFDIEEIPDIKWKLTLVLTIDPTTAIRESAYDLRRLAGRVHYVNVKMYDFYGHWNDPLKVEHHSPLTAMQDPRNVNDLAKTLVNAGVRIEKMIIGIPFYGRSYKLYDTNMTTPGSPALGPGSDYGTGIPIHTLCHIVRGGTPERYLHDKKVPYLVNGDEWIGYDNPRSVMEKANLVFNNALAGVSLFSIDMDDHKGSCGQKWPMMMAVIHGLKSYMQFITAKHESINESFRVKIRRARVSLNAYRLSGKMRKVSEMEYYIQNLQKQQQKALEQQALEHQQAQEIANRPQKLPPIHQQSWNW